MRKRGQLGIWMLLLVLLLAGCGGGSDRDSASMTASESKADSGANSAAMDMSMNSDGGAPAAAPAQQESTGSAEHQNVVAGGEAKGSSDTGVPAADVTTPGFTGSDAASGLNKKLIYRASLTMEVKDYGRAQTEVRNLVTLAKGYIVQFTEDTSQYNQGGTFVMKVPAAGFSSFLDQLEKLKPENMQRNIEGQDVSEEYVDLESRLKAKQLMEEQYTDFMKKATKASDLVAFANELGKIQESIEQIKGRMRYIDQNVSYSTVELRLYQSEDSNQALLADKERGPLLDRAAKALNGSWNALVTTLEWMFIILAGLLPILLGAGVVLAVVLWVRYRTRMRRGEHSRQVGEANRGGAGTVPGAGAVEPREERSDAPKTVQEESDDENRS